MTKLEELQMLHCNYISSMGGYYEILEVDDTNNDYNRQEVAAFKELHGRAYLGSINYYDEERKEVVSKKHSIYEEYTGQTVLNFSCSFCVPIIDPVLEQLVLEWNSGCTPVSLIERIHDRIKQIHGIRLIWF